MLIKTVLAVMLLFVTTFAWAVPGPMDVSAGTHNLGSTGTYAVKATNEDEVCIFCHTPHGGALNVPLWNHALPDTSVDGFTHYTSTTLSGFFSTPGMENTRPVSTESLLCLGCHDGTTAMNSISNISNRAVGGLPPDLANGQPMPAMWWNNPVIGDPADPLAVPAIPAGRNLTDDHPISFSYTDAQAHADNNGKLDTLANAKSDGVRFFGTDNRVECSTCHDPHVNYNGAGGDPDYTPFLVTPNTASALCLACHLK